MRHIFDRIAKEKLHERFKINSGGCGIFAVLIYALYKEYYPTLKIYTVGISYYHIMIKFGNAFFDCDGQNDEFSEQITNTVAFEQLLKDLQDPDDWNPDFNRKHVPTIIEIIRKIYVTLPVDAHYAHENRKVRRLARVYGVKQRPVSSDDVTSRLTEIQRLLVEGTGQTCVHDQRNLSLRLQDEKQPYAFRILGGIISKIFRR
jgi:hypothetical protein